MNIDLAKLAVDFDALKKRHDRVESNLREMRTEIVTALVTARRIAITIHGGPPAMRPS